MPSWRRAKASGCKRTTISFYISLSFNSKKYPFLYRCYIETSIVNLKIIKSTLNRKGSLRNKKVISFKTKPQYKNPRNIFVLSDVYLNEYSKLISVGFKFHQIYTQMRINLNYFIFRCERKW